MFVTITESEFWDALKQAKRQPEILQLNDLDRQLVVGWPVMQHGAPTSLVVQVYTSIFGRPGDGRSRGVGKDSMRVCLVDTKARAGRGRTTYTQRTQGWQQRLIDKVKDMFALAQKQLAAPCCPQCDAKMALRTAGRGTNAGQQFWGCVEYPRCRGTRPAERVTRTVTEQPSINRLAADRAAVSRWS